MATEKEMTDSDKKIAKVVERLKQRGVTEDHCNQFTNELEENEYDYDALLEDVSDKEQSMLLDFFRDTLDDIELFDKLVAAIKEETESIEEG